MAAWNFFRIPDAHNVSPESFASLLVTKLAHTHAKCRYNSSGAHIPDRARVRSARELFMQAKEEFLGIALIEPHLLPLPRRLQFKPRVTRGELFCSLSARTSWKMRLALKVNYIACQSNKQDALFLFLHEDAENLELSC
jgi:hypothetical protein